MTTRQRLEELGALRILLDRINEDEILGFYTGRPKDFADWFFSKEKDCQYEYLTQMAYGLREVSERICECIMIARGDLE